MPRGLMGTIETAGGVGGIVASGGSAILPMLGAAMTASPRIVGEVVHALGLGVRGTNALMDLLNKFVTPSTAVGVGLLNRASPTQGNSSGNALPANQNSTQSGLIPSPIPSQ